MEHLERDHGIEISVDLGPKGAMAWINMAGNLEDIKIASWQLEWCSDNAPIIKQLYLESFEREENKQIASQKGTALETEKKEKNLEELAVLPIGILEDTNGPRNLEGCGSCWGD